MRRAAMLARGRPVALATNGTVRLARGFASRTNTLPSFTAYCTLSRPTTPSAAAIARVWRSIVSTTSTRSVWGGIAHRIDVDLHRVLQETVDEHRALRADASLADQSCRDRLHHPGHPVLVVDDLHGAPAEHVARTHEHREPDPRR